MKEFQIINEFFLDLAKKNSSSLNLNDDVFFYKNKKLAISVDTYVNGNHFLNFNDPELVIKKIIRSSISDLVCKGAKPKFYFISGSGNKKYFNKKNLYAITKALRSEQKKYDIKLSGGDTVKSKELSFTIIAIGFSSNIVLRNKAKNNDHIYITGKIGDSFIGLNCLKKKINLTPKLKRYFIQKYYLPNIKYKFTNDLLKFANTSIDVSDGLFADMDKLINSQNLKYKLFLNNIPISNYLKKILIEKKIAKSKVVSNGDDYQILFTVDPKKSRIIERLAKKTNTKITKIGFIDNSLKTSEIIDENGHKILIKNKGYEHLFWS